MPSHSAEKCTALNTRYAVHRITGNAGGGKGLSSRSTQDVARDAEIRQPSNPLSVQKLQMALHAKAKAEAGYRFYAFYEKILREDLLAHAYAQCHSNKGAPGVVGQEFADVEAYGVQRWLGYERDVETELRRGYSGTARRKGRQQTNWTYCCRATSPLYRHSTIDLAVGVRYVTHVPDRALHSLLNTDCRHAAVH